MSDNTTNFSKKPATEIIVDGNTLRLFSIENEANLDMKIQNLTQYLTDNHGYGTDESIKDGLYETATNMFKDFGEYFRDVKYSLHLTKKQFNFITNLLITKLEYNAETVFDAIALSSMLVSWKEINDKNVKIKLAKGKEDTVTYPYYFDVTEMNYLIRLITLHKVKGLQPETYIFAEVIRKIDTITTLFKYYNSIFEFLKSDIHTWVAEFDGVTVEGNIHSLSRLNKARNNMSQINASEVVQVNEVTQEATVGVSDVTISKAPKLKNDKKKVKEVTE